MSIPFKLRGHPEIRAASGRGVLPVILWKICKANDEIEPSRQACTTCLCKLESLLRCVVAREQY
jgi:hypothetical protein